MKGKRLIILLLCLCMVFAGAFVACSETDYGTLTIADITVEEGATADIAAAFSNDEGKGEITYTFDGANISIADGKVKGLVGGTETTVTAKTEHHEVTFKVKVTAKPQADYGTLSIADITVEEGASAEIVPVFSKDEGKGEITYTFDGSNISIANGKVNGLVGGTETTVTAKTAHHEITFKVTVTAKPQVDYGTLSIADITVEEGASAEIVPVFSKDEGKGEITYTFDGNNISIANGKVNGLVDGTETTVTAKTEHHEVTFKVKVTAKPQVDYGTLTIADITVEEGASADIVPVFSKEEGKGEITYTFDGANISIADGKVKGLVGGTETTVTAKTAYHEVTFKVTVVGIDEERAAYSVEVYKQRKDRSGYDMTELTNPQWLATVGSEISVTEETVTDLVPVSETTGYVFDAENENGVLRAEVTADGATLKLYFNIITVTVTFKADGAEDKSVELDYGDKAEVPETPVKEGDEEYEYDFDGWYDGDTEWNFEENAFTEDIVLTAKFTPHRLQTVTVKFVSDTMTVAGVKVPTTEISAISSVAVGKDGDMKPVTLDENGAASVKLRAGEYKVTYENDSVASETEFTVLEEDLTQITVVGFKAKLGGKMGEYSSFGSGWNKLADDKLELTSHSWAFADATEAELTDRYYFEADVNLKTDGKFVGVLAACDYADISGEGTGRKLAFSHSGGNIIYVGNGGAGGWGQFDTSGYINVRLAQSTNHKFGLLRDKDVYYLIVNDRLVNTYKDDTYGKCTFGFINYAGDGNAVFSNIKYTRIPSAVDKLVEFFDTTPQLGGGYTRADGKVVPSFGGGFTLTGRDSGTLSGPTYIFNGGTVGSVYYVEAEFENVDGWAGILINALDGEPTNNKGWFGFGVLDKNLYMHKYQGSWSEGDYKGSVADSNTNFKLGVLRINDRYMVYVNGSLVLNETVTAYSTLNNSVALPADNDSGFGLYMGGNNSAKGEFKNFRYTMDLNEIMEITGSATVGSVDESITLNQSGNVMDGKLIEGITVFMTVKVPDGKIMGKLEVLCDGQPVELTVENGNISFVPVKGEYEIKVSFIDEGTATLNVDVLPYQITVGDTAYELYEGDVLPAEVTLRITNLNTETEKVYTPASLSGNSYNLDSGFYRVGVEYKNNVYETTLELTKDSTETLKGYVSLAYLGGEITIPNSSDVETTYKSYNNASVSATSGANWKLENGRRDSITMTSHTYVFQNGFAGTKYYVEGVFDTGECNDILNKFGGLLVSHGPDNLSDSSDVKFIAGFYGKSLAVCNIPTGWGIDDLRLLVNLDETGIDYNPSAVKLGVVRDGVNYYFFINDVFVKSYIYKGVTTKCGVGVAASPAALTVRHFNYSASAALIDALIANAPAAEEKEIDIYVIAGQSNASGYSAYNPLGVNDNTLLYGTNNILYAGDAESSADNNTRTVHREVGWSLARIGLGAWVNKFGAEAGMAQTLKSYYNKTSGKTAGIIKYAHGGTSLLNNLGGENNCNGNWVSPSYQATLTDGVAEKTGGLYRQLLVQVEKHVGELKEMGYTQINFKGLFWMQGESDKGSPREYKKAFGYFASDIRRDLGEIAGADLSHLPIIVGEISRTSGSAEISTVNTNNNFIAMQNDLPQSVSDIYVVKSGELDINEMRGGSSVAVGTDSWHWNQSDMISIGNLVGGCILENILA